MDGLGARDGARARRPEVSCICTRSNPNPITLPISHDMRCKRADIIKWGARRFWACWARRRASLGFGKRIDLIVPAHQGIGQRYYRAVRCAHRVLLSVHVVSGGGHFRRVGGRRDHPSLVEV
jgi:hypothetical protein